MANCTKHCESSKELSDRTPEKEHIYTKDRAELKAPGTGSESHIAGLNDPHTGHVV